MLAAIGAKGVTTVSNAAREPEIVDLQAFLQKLGPAFTAQAPPPWSSKARRSRSMAAATGF